MLIRFRYATGVQTVTVPDDATFSQAQQLAREAFKLPGEQSIELWAGFPQKPLAGAADELASKAGMKGGQQVDVRLVAGAGAASLPAAAAAAPAPAAAAATSVLTGSTAKADSGSSGSSSFSWSCGACTLVNPPQLTVCDVCGTARPQLKPAAQMERHVVPADNSCLFTSVGFATDEASHSMSRAAELRRRVADHIRAHPDKYGDAMLGKPVAAYLAALNTPDFWGGGVECSVLSELFKIEVVAIDIRTALALRFGEDQGYSKRCFLIYDGIHYDALCLKDRATRAVTKTIFEVSDEGAMEQALRIGRELKEARAFVDTANFSLICLDCSQGLKGEKEAQEHAKLTKHTNFAEKR